MSHEERNLELAVKAKWVKKSIKTVLKEIESGKKFSPDFFNGYLQSLDTNLTINN